MLHSHCGTLIYCICILYVVVYLHIASYYYIIIYHYYLIKSYWYHIIHVFQHRRFLIFLSNSSFGDFEHSFISFGWTRFVHHASEEDMQMIQFQTSAAAVRPACASRWNVAKFNFCQVTPAKGLKTLSQMTSKCCENLWDSWSGRTEPSVLVLDETWPNGLRRLIKPSLMTSRMREHPKIVGVLERSGWTKAGGRKLVFGEWNSAMKMKKMKMTEEETKV